MVEILKTLRDTPLPSLLVIGGLIFLLIPFIRGTKGTIELETTNKGYATFLGIVLLIGGIGLYILPSLFHVPSTEIVATQTPFSVVVTASSNSETLLEPTATSISSLPTLQPSSGGGGCASIPANPQDGVDVQLESSQWYLIEEYDNQASPPTLIFRVQLGTISVTANATRGSRAWECPSESEAFLQAQLSAMGYKQSNPPHKVIGPDGQEVE